MGDRNRGGATAPSVEGRRPLPLLPQPLESPSYFDFGQRKRSFLPRPRSLQDRNPNLASGGDGRLQSKAIPVVVVSATANRSNLVQQFHPCSAIRKPFDLDVHGRGRETAQELRQHKRYQHATGCDSGRRRCRGGSTQLSTSRRHRHEPPGDIDTSRCVRRARRGCSTGPTCATDGNWPRAWPSCW